jgi:hypothetical protein
MFIIFEVIIVNKHSKFDFNLSISSFEKLHSKMPSYLNFFSQWIIFFFESRIPEWISER